jgi:proteasome lid subunit RPN8/RPN11
MIFVRLTIPDLLVEEVIEHAWQTRPNECCGLLAGHIRDGVGVITTHFPIKNALASPTEYETDARDMLFAFRHMREHGLELLAVYHSHLTSAPVPSVRDMERNTYGETVVHLIVSLAGSEPTVKGWWLGETSYREAEVVVEGKE